MNCRLLTLSTYQTQFKLRPKQDTEKENIAEYKVLKSQEVRFSHFNERQAAYPHLWMALHNCTNLPGTVPSSRGQRSKCQISHQQQEWQMRGPGDDCWILNDRETRVNATQLPGTVYRSSNLFSGDGAQEDSAVRMVSVVSNHATLLQVLNLSSTGHKPGHNRGYIQS